MIAQIKRLFRAEIKYMYCMYTLSRPWAFKIGISEKPHARRKQIDGQMKTVMGAEVNIRIFPPLPMLFSRLAEKQIHRIGRKTGFATQWADGTSGKTEWYQCPNIITALWIWYFLGNSELALCAIICPVVWDAWLLTFAVFFLDIAVFWLGVWVIITYIF